MGKGKEKPRKGKMEQMQEENDIKGRGILMGKRKEEMKGKGKGHYKGNEKKQGNERSGKGKYSEQRK